MMTKINAGLTIKEPMGGIRFGTDALLLAHYMLPHAGKNGLDIGTGSGVIPLLYLSVDKQSRMCGIEIQDEFAICASQNAAQNSLDDRFTVIHGDIREYKKHFESGRFDFICSNPPYYKQGSGLKSNVSKKDDAFRENDCNLSDVLTAAAWLLKSGGRFYIVYRPERLSELLCQMHSHRIEPKSLTLVIPDSDSKPSLVLVAGRKDGAEGMTVTSPLCIYKDKSHKEYTDALKGIYDTF